MTNNKLNMTLEAYIGTFYAPLDSEFVRKTQSALYVTV